MNKKVPITRPIHPKFIIQHSINSAVRDLYDISWHPRVVRQKKSISVGSHLAYLDYAVPCFELGQQVDLPVAEITSAIVDVLAAKLNLKPDSEYFNCLKFEAIGGYVNVALEESYIRTATNNAVSWFGQPELLTETGSIDALIIGYDINDSAVLKTAYEAAKDFLDLKVFLHTEQKLTYILPDTSQQAITQLVEAMASPDVSNSHKHKLELYRKIRHSFTPDADTDFAKQVQSLIQDTVLNNSVFKRLLQLKGGEVIQQSSLTSLVDSFLDTSFREQAKQTDRIIFDEANKALYYTNPGLDNVVPLRSAEGYIYNAAYQLFSLQRAMTKLHDNNQKLLVIAPHTQHVLIKDWLETLPPESVPNIVLFDPQVSKADIDEVNTVFPDLTTLFEHVSRRLQATPDSDFQDALLRQDVLLFIDFPMDVTSYISDLQPPALFDLFNQMMRALVTEQA